MLNYLPQEPDPKFIELAELAPLLKALGEPSRLSIFNVLMEGVQCNCEIAEHLNLSLSLISHHLRVLREVGLVDRVRDAKDARWIYYSVNKETLRRLNVAVKHLLDPDRIQPRVPSCGPKKTI